MPRAFSFELGNQTSPSGTDSNTVSNLPCDPSVAVGDVVRMSGTTVIQALADTTTNGALIGICESKQSSVLCTVRFFGISAVAFIGLDTSKNYFLSESTPGGMVTAPPSGSGNIVKIVGRPVSSTAFVVGPEIGLVRA